MTISRAVFRDSGTCQGHSVRCQYFPEGTDLSVHSPEVLQAAADSLNGRPRETLGGMTPLEKLSELGAPTD